MNDALESDIFVTKSGIDLPQTNTDMDTCLQLARGLLSGTPRTSEAQKEDQDLLIKLLKKPFVDQALNAYLERMDDSSTEKIPLRAYLARLQ